MSESLKFEGSPTAILAQLPATLYGISTLSFHLTETTFFPLRANHLLENILVLGLEDHENVADNGEDDVAENGEEDDNMVENVAELPGFMTVRQLHHQELAYYDAYCVAEADLFTAVGELLDQLLLGEYTQVILSMVTITGGMTCFIIDQHDLNVNPSGASTLASVVIPKLGRFSNHISLTVSETIWNAICCLKNPLGNIIDICIVMDSISVALDSESMEIITETAPGNEVFQSPYFRQEEVFVSAGQVSELVSFQGQVQHLYYDFSFFCTEYHDPEDHFPNELAHATFSAIDIIDIIVALCEPSGELHNTFALLHHQNLSPWSPGSYINLTPYNSEMAVMCRRNRDIYHRYAGACRVVLLAHQKHHYMHDRPDKHCLFGQLPKSIILIILRHYLHPDDWAIPMFEEWPEVNRHRTIDTVEKLLSERSSLLSDAEAAMYRIRLFQKNITAEGNPTSSTEMSINPMSSRNQRAMDRLTHFYQAEMTDAKGDLARIEFELEQNFRALTKMLPQAYAVIQAKEERRAWDRHKARNTNIGTIRGQPVA